MDEMERILEEQCKVKDLFTKLKETNSMPEVSDIVESMDENMAKLVLKKIYIFNRSTIIYIRGANMDKNLNGLGNL